MKPTKVINATNILFVFNEATAGLNRKLSTLAPRSGSYTIHVDPNATYREYWFKPEDPVHSDIRLDVSSDDCQEYKEIRIIEGNSEDQKYKWVGVRRDTGKVEPEGGGNDSTSPGTGDTSKGIWQKITGLFKRGT